MRVFLRIPVVIVILTISGESWELLGADLLDVLDTLSSWESRRLLDWRDGDGNGLGTVDEVLPVMSENRHL